VLSLRNKIDITNQPLLKREIRKNDRDATNRELTFTVLATFGAVGVGGAGSGAHGHPGEPNKLTKRRMAAANLAATRKHYNYHFFHHSTITIHTIAISKHRPQSPYKSPVSATANVSKLQ